MFAKGLVKRFQCFIKFEHESSTKNFNKKIYINESKLPAIIKCSYISPKNIDSYFRKIFSIDTCVFLLLLLFFVKTWIQSSILMFLAFHYHSSENIKIYRYSSNIGGCTTTFLLLNKHSYTYRYRNKWQMYGYWCGAFLFVVYKQFQ